MRTAFTLTFVVLALAACSNPHRQYYFEHGSLHPDLLATQHQECLNLGFKDGTNEMAECRKDLAQDWKYNVEAGRRDLRPTVGIHYGIYDRW